MLKAENKNVQHQRRPEIVPRHLWCKTDVHTLSAAIYKKKNNTIYNCYLGIKIQNPLESRVRIPSLK